jgi:hypothetical protein
VSFEDDISALIDRPCRRDGCTQTLPESCPSDDFCSEVCETTWRAENNGCRVEDYDDFGIDVIVPDGHPAAPSYRSPQEGAFSDDGPPRSFLHYMQRQLNRLWDRLILGDVESFEPRGILSATEPREQRPPSAATGLMQIMHSGRTELPVPPSNGLARFLDQYGVTPRVWSQPGTFQAPAVPPTEAELRRVCEQVARIFEVPLAMLEPPPPPPSVADAVGFEVITDPLIPPGFAFVRPRGQIHFHASLDPAVPDAEPIFYTREERYDPQSNRVVFELRAHLPPAPMWVNVQFDGVGFVDSLHGRRAAAAERDRLLHGEWPENLQDVLTGTPRLERLEGAGLDELGNAVEEPEPEIPPYRDQSET